MGLLHRVFAGSRADVWETETRLLHGLGLVRRPVAVQWLVTAACDMKCPHCYSAAGKRATGELSTQEAKRLLVDELVALGCPLLVLAGGELLLRPDIPELVEYARACGLDWAMHTHGLHVPRFRPLLQRHPPVLAAISLDGDRSFHDAFRGRAGSFDAALEAAAVLADAGCREVVLGTTVTRDNADRVADMFPLVAGSRAHSWGLHLFAPEGRGHDHAELFPTPGQLRRVAAFARRRRGLFPIELCNEWGSAGAEDLYYRDQAFACGAGTISCVVSSTGDVLPCTTTDPAAREGNLRDTPLRLLWQRSFAGFRTGACGDRGECWLQTRNGVRCAEHAFGPVARPQPLWIERVPLPRRAGGRLVGERGAMAVGLFAAGLVFLQGCTKAAPPNTSASAQHEGGSPPPDEHWAGLDAPATGFPAPLAEDPRRHFESVGTYAAWRSFRLALAECMQERRRCDDAREALGMDAAGSSARPAGSTAALERHIDAIEAGDAIDFRSALAVLDEIELRPTYDAWFAGHLWRQVRARPVRDAADSRARVVLFARLRQHHRVLDAMTRAQGVVGEVQLRPWLKKSAPPPDARRLDVPAGFVDAARAAYPSATATTWESVAATLTVDGDGVELARAGNVEAVARGAQVDLGRLDVLWCPAATKLRTAGGRTLEVPAGTEVTLHDAPHLLSEADARALSAAVAEAARTGAIDPIAPELPIAHAEIRRRIASDPHAPGVPGLRTLLVGYDE